MHSYMHIFTLFIIYVVLSTIYLHNQSPMIIYLIPYKYNFPILTGDTDWHIHRYYYKKSIGGIIGSQPAIFVEVNYIDLHTPEVPSKSPRRLCTKHPGS